MSRTLLGALALVSLAGTAMADLPQLYCTGFEAPDYAPGLLTGQDEWFLPAVTGSQNFNVAAYGGSIAPNPTGGANYAIGTALSATEFARAQHAASFVNGTSYVMSYDINVQPFGGTAPPAVNNIGSFSSQTSGTTRFTQSLFVYNDLNNPAAGWTTQVSNIDAAGTNLGFLTPASPAFAGLLFNHWYRQSLTIDFATNQLQSISITDLTTNATTTVALSGVFLGGGSNNVGGLPMPDAIRMFTGGNEFNTTLWDNVCIEVVPAPATGMVALLGAGVLARRRRR